MLKRIISGVLTATMLFAFGIGVFATEDDAVLASGESIEELNDNYSSDGITVPDLNRNNRSQSENGDMSADNSTTGDTGDINQSNTLSDTGDGVTMPNDTAIVEENRTKNNRMLNNELTNIA